MPDVNEHRTLFTVLCIISLAFSGCAKVHAPSAPATVVAVPPVFSHELFDRVLLRYGSPSGKIDYAALKANSDDLDRYYRLIAATSPDSHPEIFPTDRHALAYWINAYNAAAIQIVLAYYPIDSVLAVKPPAVFFFLPTASGFFVFQKPIFGDRKISLYKLENGIVRKRFADPRIHFALNCASMGCPKLPQQTFSGDTLDEQLDAETRRFVADKRNVRIDHEAKTIFLSQIFEWYEDDFLKWLTQNDSDRPARLTRYVARYLPSEKADELAAVEADYAVQFIPYDWTLNDRR